MNLIQIKSSSLIENLRAMLVLGILCTILLPTLALADCSEVGSDAWNITAEEMALAFDSGDFNTAIYKGKQLTIVCDKHPVVNFTMANIYKKQGNEEESFNYTRKASENIQQYPIPQKLAEKNMASTCGV